MLFFEEDSGNAVIEHFVVLNRPIQVFLNKCFAAEAAVTKYVDMIKSLTFGEAGPPTLADLRLEALRRNINILDGTDGRALVHGPIRSLCPVSLPPHPYYDLAIHPTRNSNQKNIMGHMFGVSCQSMG